MPLSPRDTRRNPQADKFKRRDTVSRIKDDKNRTQTKGRPGTALPNVTRTGNSGLGTFQARKNALYASARRSAKGLVQSSITMLEDMQAKLDELKGQQTTFQKICDDSNGPRVVLQQDIAGLGKVYAPMLDDLGEKRSEILEGASTMRNTRPLLLLGRNSNICFKCSET
ncbi:hypothetical protein D9619_005893 [Psilocybe cf. subviscida]|uniref:Uncharacterized protein n=1 Tax=Psilocybe cf. subviscida TaxID=2480587 RepID=A0A8H5BX61_9AGAR|nr:hypothetical protein D9619_005893 [Psilocybe cf. subviscida]